MCVTCHCSFVLGCYFLFVNNRFNLLMSLLCLTWLWFQNLRLHFANECQQFGNSSNTKYKNILRILVFSSPSTEKFSFRSLSNKWRRILPREECWNNILYQILLKIFQRNLVNIILANGFEISEMLSYLNFIRKCIHFGNLNS